MRSADLRPPGTIKPLETTPPGPRGKLIEADAGTDVWDLHGQGHWVLIPTNTERKSDGTAVMGAGLALDAATRFPDVPARYGRALAVGNARVVLTNHRLLLGPTKTHWRRPATMALVVELLDAVARWTDANPTERIAVASPGCGRGGLAWDQVRTAALQRLTGRNVNLLPPAR